MLLLYIVSVTTLIVWVLNLHSKLNATRAQLAIAEHATEIAINTWKVNAETVQRLTEEYAVLDKRYTTMETTFLHNERQLKKLITELRAELVHVNKLRNP